MRKINKLTKLIGIAAIAALAFTGCGASGSSAASNGNSSDNSATSNNVTDDSNEPAVLSNNTNDVLSEGSGNTGEGEDIGEFTIRVGVCSGDVNHYLKILDNHTGLFKNNGINFEITEFAAGINTIDAITIDQLDIGMFADYAGINRIGNTLNDTELRAFAVIGKSNKTILYINPETIKEPSDLENATLISMAGVVVEYEYGKLFEHYGLEASKANFANVGSAQEGLALAAAGDADTVWSNPQTFAMYEEYGWEPYVSIGDVDATMYTFLVANDSYLTAHQKEVERFLTVSEEGFQYINENLEEFADWVEADLGLNKDLVISGWQGEEHGYSFSQEAYEDLKKVEDWCYHNGNFNTEYDVADFINTDALQVIKPDSVTWSAEN